MALNKVDLPTLGRPTIPALSMDLRYFTRAERVVELVGVLSVGDDDRQATRKTRQLVRAGIGYHRHRQLRFAARHRAAVLEHERASATVQRACDPLERDIAG